MNDTAQKRSEKSMAIQSAVSPRQSGQDGVCLFDLMFWGRSHRRNTLDHIVLLLVA